MVVDVDGPTDAELPKTLTQRTARGTHHVYRAHGPIRQGSKVSPNVDTRVGGSGYLVGAPSLHASGSVYEWTDGFDPTRIADAPTWVYRDADPNRRPDGRPSDHGEPIDRGARNGTLASLAGSMRHAGLTAGEIEAALQVVNRDRCDPPLARAEVAAIAASIGRYPTGSGPQPRPDAVDDERWVPLRIGHLVRDGVPPADWTYPPLLYRGHATTIYGESGAGKTLLAAAIASALLAAGGSVVYLDEENGQAIMATRLRGLGADPDAVDARFHYLDFRSPTLSDSDALAEAIGRLAPDLVVFDSGADFYVAAQLDENDNSAMTAWAKAFPQRLARELGVSSLLIESVNTKGETQRARGAGAKKYKADATWRLEVLAPPTVERVGLVTLHRTKDRLGHLPERISFRLGGDGSGRIEFGVDASQAADERHAARDERYEHWRDLVLMTLRGERATSRERAISTNRLLELLPPHNRAELLKVVKQMAWDLTVPMRQETGPRRSLVCWIAGDPEEPP